MITHERAVKYLKKEPVLDVLVTRAKPKQHLEKDAFPNLKVGFGAIAFGDFRYDQLMERHIANEFNKNILCPEEPLPRAVVEQLLLFSFSFAVRLLLSFEYYYYVFNQSDVDWQIKTLLSGYKTLSTKSDTNGMDDKSNVRNVEQQPPELYTFVKQNLVEIIGKRSAAKVKVNGQIASLRIRAFWEGFVETCKF
ncbi:hypothetical protein GPALN_004841 [Globodera pallida]|nr:hypothetical protein GPALN_004841 [Globodera pallida]